MKNTRESFISELSNKEFPISEKVSGKAIRKAILELIQIDNPTFNENSIISTNELNLYREKYISNYLLKEIGELNDLENNVLDSLKDRTIITDEEEGTSSSFGQRLADKVATFGGSWKFIIIFGSFLTVWILFNVLWLKNQAFDPYPFILLNLILSCIAAMQAPVIMMSQNRQEEKDRERAKKDYMVNLKSELEIRMLHEKIDHLIMHQQQELLEIQKVQIEMMDDIIQRIEKTK